MLLYFSILLFIPTFALENANFNFMLMKRKDFNIYKREIRRLLKQIDDSFEPNHPYDECSNILRDSANLRYVASLLFNDLNK